MTRATNAAPSPPAYAARLLPVAAYCWLAGPWMASAEFPNPPALFSPVLLAVLAVGFLAPRARVLLPVTSTVCVAAWIAVRGPFRDTLLGLRSFRQSDLVLALLVLWGSLLVLDIARALSRADRRRPAWMPLGAAAFAYGIALPVVLLALAALLLVNGATSRQALLFLASLVLGSAVADLFLRAGGAARAARTAEPWLAWAVPALALVPCVTLAADVWSEREPADPAPTRMALATGIYGDLSLLYPHWDGAPLEPEALWRQYRPRLSAGDRVCGDDAGPCIPFLHALRDMLAALQNGHTYVVIAREEGGLPVSVEPVEGKAAITYVEEGSSAERAGLEAGMAIVEVEGQPAAEFLRRTPASRNPGASSRTREYDAYQAMLDGIPGTRVSLTVESGSGARKTVTLAREPLDLESVHELHTQDAPLDFEREDGGLVFASLDGFYGRDLDARLDRLQAALSGSKGLILDLRDNTGGEVRLALALAGRFVDRRITIGRLCSADEGTSDEPEMSCSDLVVEPRDDRYAGPVAVLLNQGTASAAEIAAYALCRTGRARCFGRATAGETDTTEFTDLPGGYAQIGSGEFRPGLGPSIYGVGVSPDVPVTPTLEDYRAGVDPDQEAARKWLGLPSGEPSPSSQAGSPRTASRPGRPPEDRAHEHRHPKEDRP